MESSEQRSREDLNKFWIMPKVNSMELALREFFVRSEAFKGENTRIRDICKRKWSLQSSFHVKSCISFGSCG